MKLRPLNCLGRRRRRTVLAVALALGLAGCAGLDGGDPAVSLDELNVDIGQVAVEEAEQDLAAGRYAAARAKFGRVLAMNPEDPRATTGLAEAVLALGNPAGAFEAFSSVVDVPEQRARALQGQGLALLAMGRGAEAEPALLAAVAADPGLWRAWNALGGQRDAAADWAGAAQAYDRALAAEGADTTVVLNNRGMSFMLQQRHAEAAATFAEALRRDPGQETVRTNLRVALAWLGRYAEAEAGIAPGTAGEAYNNIGYVAMLRRDYTVAESYLLRAMEASPSYNQQAAENLRLLADVKRRNLAQTQ